MEKNSLDLFVSESYSYEDRLLFTYTPRNPDSKFDCYVMYEFREDGKILESAIKCFMETFRLKTRLCSNIPGRKMPYMNWKSR
ncbi:MAG: hypothetical protein PHW84_09845 [Methanosarcina sp.]|nr:hypothetical protein [Methanosarcina sp.]MDD4523185.1 hypothetical protein [Methanosarcina sp.]